MNMRPVHLVDQKTWYVGLAFAGALDSEVDILVVGPTSFREAGEAARRLAEEHGLAVYCVMHGQPVDVTIDYVYEVVP